MQRKCVVEGVGLSHTSTSHSGHGAHSVTCLDRNVCGAGVLGAVTRAVAPRARPTT